MSGVDIAGVASAIMAMMETVLQKTSWLIVTEERVDVSVVDSLEKQHREMEQLLAKVRSDQSVRTTERQDFQVAAERCHKLVRDLLDDLDKMRSTSWLGLKGVFKRDRLIAQRQSLIRKEEELEQALHILQYKTRLASGQPVDVTAHAKATIETANPKPIIPAGTTATERQYAASEASKSMKEPEHGTSQPEVCMSYQSPWALKRILCLGGTEIQAMACLYVLEELMDMIAELEQSGKKWVAVESSSSSPLYSPRDSKGDKPSQDHDSKSTRHYRFRPCHYFDYICGSGVGGTSAVMLGNMRFSVPEVIERSKALFDLKPLTYPLLSVSTSRLVSFRRKNSLPLKRTLEEKLTGRGPGTQFGATWHPSDSQHAKLQSDVYVCRTICVTALQAKKGIQCPYILRSYEVHEEHGQEENPIHLRNAYKDTSNMSIVDACMASVPVPLYSRSVKITGVGRFKDATMLHVNPAWEVYQEIGALNNGKHPVQCLVYIDSMDARSKENVADPDDYRSRVNDKLQYTLGEAFRHFDVLDEEVRTATRGRQQSYKSVEGVDNDSALNAIKESAEAFCQHKRESLLRCAETLVQARRDRAQTREWSRFASLKVPRHNNMTNSGKPTRTVTV